MLIICSRLIPVVMLPGLRLLAPPTGLTSRSFSLLSNCVHHYSSSFVHFLEILFWYYVLDIAWTWTWKTILRKKTEKKSWWSLFISPAGHYPGLTRTWWDKGQGTGVGKTAQSVHCTITVPCLGMHRRPSAPPAYIMHSRDWTDDIEVKETMLLSQQ